MSELFPELCQDISNVLDIINKHCQHIYHQIESQPFILLSRICRKFIDNKDPRYVSTDSTRNITINILSLSNTSILTHYSFGNGFSTSDSGRLGKTPLEYMKYRLEYLITNGVINYMKYNTSVSFDDIISMYTLASIVIEYIINTYTIDNIKTRVSQLGWQLDIKNEKKTYASRSYREGPIELIDDTITYWYLALNLT